MVGQSQTRNGRELVEVGDLVACGAGWQGGQDGLGDLLGSAVEEGAGAVDYICRRLFWLRFFRLALRECVLSRGEFGFGVYFLVGILEWLGIFWFRFWRRGGGDFDFLGVCVQSCGYGKSSCAVAD